jgi:hypothetical protein
MKFGDDGVMKFVLTGVQMGPNYELGVDIVSASGRKILVVYLFQDSGTYQYHQAQYGFMNEMTECIEL